MAFDDVVPSQVCVRRTAPESMPDRFFPGIITLDLYQPTALLRAVEVHADPLFFLSDGSKWAIFV